MKYVRKIEQINETVDIWLGEKWTATKACFEKTWFRTSVQIGIGLCLLLTLIFTCVSIRNQSEYNQRLLQPWLMPTPLEKVIIVGDSIAYGVYLQNRGRSPAFNGNAGIKVNFIDKFPYVVLDSFAPHFSIFPDDERVIEKTQKLIYKDSLGLPVDLSADSIMKLIKEGKLFLHIYLTYEDYSQHEYNFLSTFKMKIKIQPIERNTYYCDWGDIGQLCR